MARSSGHKRAPHHIAAGVVGGQSEKDICCGFVSLLRRSAPPWIHSGVGSVMRQRGHPVERTLSSNTHRTELDSPPHIGQHPARMASFGWRLWLLASDWNAQLRTHPTYVANMMIAVLEPAPLAIVTPVRIAHRDPSNFSTANQCIHIFMRVCFNLYMCICVGSNMQCQRSNLWSIQRVGETAGRTEIQRIKTVETVFEARKHVRDSKLKLHIPL